MKSLLETAHEGKVANPVVDPRLNSPENLAKMAAAVVRETAPTEPLPGRRVVDAVTT